MKLRIKDSLIFRALILTLFLSVGFLFLGGQIARTLDRVGREERRLEGLSSHASMLQDLIVKYQIPPEEALQILQRSLPPHFPIRYQLVPKASVLENHQHMDSIELPSSELTLVAKRPARRELRHSAPPPRRFMLAGFAISLGSLFCALILSSILIIWFLRRKSWEVGQVLTQLKEGNLQARIPYQGIDELTGLTNKFNQMADSIQALVTNLRQTEESRRLLLEELAHDLRTPVASLKSATEIIQLKWDSLSDEKRSDLTKMIVVETRYFEKLLDDLLFLSGLAEPKYRLSYRAFSLSDLVQEIGLSFSHPKLKFEINSSHELHGDQVLIKRLLQNALGNALRFAQKEVLLKVEEDHHQLTITICDDGKGFSPQELEQFGKRKFSRQWEKKEDGDHLSIGLGSTIMVKIVELHQGIIQASNRLEGGAMIQIIFPNKK